MKLPHSFFRAVILLTVFPAQNLITRAQKQPSDVPTFQLNSSLVFLDVTVLDKKGNPVVTGLTKDDFTITEDRKPQRIFSFEGPDVHQIANAEENHITGKAPLNIIVLDLLDSEFQDFAYIRYELRQFLMAQPAQLADPAELMVVGNQSLEMLQGYTRSRADLLDALDHLPAVLPYKKMLPSFYWERFAQSIDALQQIALQNKGVPGRKNIVWVGHGGPNIFLNTADLTGSDVERLKQYVHDTTNLLVNSRISLFVIYPDLKIHGNVMPISAGYSDVDLGDGDPFSGDVNFGVFVNESGGKLFFNRNDVDMEIKRSEEMGANYYTLTYQPQEQNANADGKFRRIRVTLRNPSLRAVTKAGYFAPTKNQKNDPGQRTLINLLEAAESTIPFNGLHVDLTGVVRHPDALTVEVALQLKSKNLNWLPESEKTNSANLAIAAVSLNGDEKVVASRLQNITLSADAGQAAQATGIVSRFRITLPVPRKTKRVRIVVDNVDGGRMGSVDLTRKAIDAAPAAPTSEPHLAPTGPNYMPAAK